MRLSIVRGITTDCYVDMIFSQQNDFSLAPKELLYLSGRAHGLSNKEIAKEFGVSHRTVEGAMKRVLFKLDARKVTEAVFKATTEGLLCAVFTDTDQPFRIRTGRGRPISSLRIRLVGTGRDFYV